MAVPKKKISPSRRGMRNSHNRIAILNRSECSNCGALKIMHHMCDTCGFYDGKKIFVTKRERKAAKEAIEEAN